MAKKFYFYTCIHEDNDKYDPQRLGEVDSLVKLNEFINDITKFNSWIFAIFKDDIEPNYEDVRNRYSYTYMVENNDFIQFIQKCWNDNILYDKKFNGIYCTPKKVSLWLNTKPCNLDIWFSLKNSGFNMSFNRLEPDTLLLRKNCIIGKFEENRFDIPEQSLYENYIKVNSQEKLKRAMLSPYSLKACQGIFLTFFTNVINFDEWRNHSINNRFVLFEINMNIEYANNIMCHLSPFICSTMFDNFESLCLVFFYYFGKTLQIGLYLNGERSMVDLDASEQALKVAYKIGDFIKSLIPEFADDQLNAIITNSIPSRNCDFKAFVNEFPITEKRVRLELIFSK